MNFSNAFFQSRLKSIDDDDGSRSKTQPKAKAGAKKTGGAALRKRGTLASMGKKGFAYVTPDDGAADIFCLKKDLVGLSQDDVRAKTTVEFRVEYVEGEERAVDVRRVGGRGERPACGRAELLAKRGSFGQMQISAELVPIPDASGCVPDASGF